MKLLKEEEVRNRKANQISSEKRRTNDGGKHQNLKFDPRTGSALNDSQENS